MDNLSENTEKKVKRSCGRCRNHGLKIALTGHKSKCPYKTCACLMCNVTTRSNLLNMRERRMNIDFKKNRLREENSIIPQETRIWPGSTADESCEAHQNEEEEEIVAPLNSPAFIDELLELQFITEEWHLSFSGFDRSDFESDDLCFDWIDSLINLVPN